MENNMENLKIKFCQKGLGEIIIFLCKTFAKIFWTISNKNFGCYRQSEQKLFYEQRAMSYSYSATPINNTGLQKKMTKMIAI